MRAADGVIVLGIDTPIGLTIVRELGQRGVNVHGIAASRRAVGLYSRYLKQGYIHGRRDSALIDLIKKIAADQEARYLMTVSEGDILFLNRHAVDLNGITPLIPSATAMHRVLDKEQCCREAQQVGLDVPETIQIESLNDLENVADGLTYPVILKWSNPADILPRLTAAGLTYQKAEYCYDERALRQAMGRYPQIGRYPLIQSYCDGYGIGQMVLMHKGPPVLRFQHRRLHEWPPEGGVSTLCESVALDEHGDLFERSVALLQRIGWEGPAMVEYRYSPTRRRAVFMEVNGRFWGSLPLAYHAGVHFAWGTYAALGRGLSMEQPTYRGGLRCRYAIPEAKRLAVILFRRRSIQDRSLRFNRLTELCRFACGFLSPSTRGYVASIKDPLPFIADLSHAALECVRRTFSCLWRTLASLSSRPNGRRQQATLETS